MWVSGSDEAACGTEQKRKDSELPHIQLKDLFQARNGARVECGTEIALPRAGKLVRVDKKHPEKERNSLQVLVGPGKNHLRAQRAKVKQILWRKAMHTLQYVRVRGRPRGQTLVLLIKTRFDLNWNAGQINNL